MNSCRIASRQIYLHSQLQNSSSVPAHTHTPSKWMYSNEAKEEMHRTEAVCLLPACCADTAEKKSFKKNGVYKSSNWQ